MSLSRVSRRRFGETRFNNLSMIKNFGSCYIQAVTEFDDVNNSVVLNNIGKYYAYLVNSHENMVGDLNFGYKSGGGSNFSTNIIVGNYSNNIGESCYMNIYERQDLIEQWSKIHFKYQKNKRRINTNLIFDITDKNANNCYELLEMSYEFGVNGVIISLWPLFSNEFNNCNDDTIVTNNIIEFLQEIEEINDKLSNKREIYSTYYPTIHHSSFMNGTIYNTNTNTNTNSDSNSNIINNIPFILDFSNLILNENSSILENAKRYCRLMCTIATKLKNENMKNNIMFNVDNINGDTIGEYLKISDKLHNIPLFFNFEHHNNQSFYKIFGTNCSQNTQNISGTSDTNNKTETVHNATESPNDSDKNVSNSQKTENNNNNNNNNNNSINNNSDTNNFINEKLPPNWHHFLKFGRMSNYFNIFPSLTYCIDSHFTRILTKCANNSEVNIDEFYEFDRISHQLSNLYSKYNNNINLINKIALSNENKFIINPQFALNIFDNINCRHCDPKYNNNNNNNNNNEITLGLQWEIEDSLARISRIFEHYTIDNSQCSYNLFKLLDNNTMLYKQIKNQIKCDIFGLKSAGNALISDYNSYSVSNYNMDDHSNRDNRDNNELRENRDDSFELDLRTIDWENPVCSSHTVEFIEECTLLSNDNQNNNMDKIYSIGNNDEIEKRNNKNNRGVSMFNVIDSDFDCDNKHNNHNNGSFKILATIGSNIDDENDNGQNFFKRKSKNLK